MIRQMQLQDAPTLCAIYNYYVQHSTATFDTHLLSVAEMTEKLRPILEKYPAWVCETDGLIRGYCYAHEWKTKDAYALTWETTIYLHPEAVGQHWGTRLMQQLIADCRKRGAHSLIACITTPNPASEQLHCRLGFQKVSFFREVGQKMNQWLAISDYQLVLSD